MKPQLLDLFNTAPTFNNFIAIGNEAIYASLNNSTHQFTHITGIKSSGKTHLLKAWVNMHLGHNKSAIYLDANAQPQIKILESNYQFIAIDNIEVLTNNLQIELFDLFNTIKLNSKNNFLLTSSRKSFDTNHSMRDDLITRILSGLNLQLVALNDEELFMGISSYIKKEGFNFGEAELKYLISHYERNIGTLIKKIHLIADEALLQKRDITIPLIKQVAQ